MIRLVLYLCDQRSKTPKHGGKKKKEKGRKKIKKDQNAVVSLFQNESVNINLFQPMAQHCHII